MATAQQRVSYHASGFVQPRMSPSEPTPREVYQPEDEEEEIVQYVGKGPVQFRGESNLLTKNGKPDRRFRGQRDLPEEEVINPQYRRAASGMMLEGVHVTSDGTPDRRYKENRHITDEEAEIRKAELILAKYGRQRH